MGRFRKKTGVDSGAAVAEIPSMPTRNYVYKVKRVVEGGEHRGPIDQQFYFAHQYRNAKIEIERERRVATHAVVSEFDPEIPRLEALLEEVEKSLDAIDVDIRRRNQSLRKTTMATKEDRERRKELKSTRKESAVSLKERKAVAYADPALTDRLATIAEQAKASEAKAYAESPAFWGSKLYIKDSLKDIGKGAPPDPRRWSMEGGIAVQIQHGITWEAMKSCSDNRVRLEVPAPACYRPTHSKTGVFLPPPDPDSRRSLETKLGLLSIRIGSNSDGKKSPVWAKMLVYIHREPPPDTLVKWAYLHRHVVGRQVTWKVRFALTRESWPMERAQSGTVRVSIGWWPEEDGGLRVATAVGGDGITRHMTITKSDLDRWSGSEGYRSIRDRLFNSIREGLLAWKSECKKQKRKLPGWMAESLEYLHTWKSPERLQSLAWKWKDGRFPADRMVIEGMADWREGHKRIEEKLGTQTRSVFDEIAAWRTQDRHLHDTQDSQREKAVRWRDEQYRRFVAILRVTYKEAQIIDIDWTEEKRAAEAGDKDNPETRTVLQVAAPGRLQAFLVESFGKENVARVEREKWDKDAPGDL